MKFYMKSLESLMKSKLIVNESKGKDLTVHHPFDSMEGLWDETGELDEALKSGSRGDVLLEIADVGNHLLMLFAHVLVTPKEQLKEEQEEYRMRRENDVPF